MGATAAGLAGILSFHSRGTTGLLANSVSVKSGSSAPSNASKTSTPSTTAPPSSNGNGVSGPTTVPTTAPQSPTTTAASSATGVSEQYGYGTLSVRVTITGSRITDVKVANLQTIDQYSQQLAVQVIPYLRRQVLSLQTARISGISGATYTSEAYAYSLQSALDKLHFH
jgi:uncharacterized protein with FMN-binding domain